ncbi:MAG: hypothetical protein PHS93_10275 [Candidatus Omnitrophica bacterium]|nr:hypothetical protein [Candidatus Omnitrophota bacterium]
MKKQQVKIQVIHKISENDLKDIGGNRWTKRNLKWLIPVCVVVLVWVYIAGKYLCNENIWGQFLLMCVPMSALFAVWEVNYVKAGKILWNEVKDKPQPIDLDSAENK